MTEPVTEKKRGPGRPPGYPKTGGRKKGTTNRDTTETRSRITREADPIGFLCKVVRGDRVLGATRAGTKKTYVYPTFDQRVAAANTLARKVLSDLKSIEIGGDDWLGLLASQIATFDDKRKPNRFESAMENGACNGDEVPRSDAPVVREQPACVRSA